jgi:muconolactone delta-isomerase
MEYLVEFQVNVPDGTPDPEVKHLESAEAAAAAELVAQGHLARLWKPPITAGETKILGLYRADSRTQLDDLLGGLPLHDWMHITVTPLQPHPNDPARPASSTDTPRPQQPPVSNRLPDPHLTPVYRLEATLAQPLDLGDISQGYRRIVPLTGGTFTGPDIKGKLLPGASADWQIVRPDGTALGDIRYILQADRGDLLYVQSRAVRHGSAGVLDRLAAGEHVDASEYVFRASTQIETAAPDLDWLNKGIFITVAGRQPAGVIYETYLVG